MVRGARFAGHGFDKNMMALEILYSNAAALFNQNPNSGHIHPARWV
jgi:hypothetical protein